MDSVLRFLGDHKEVWTIPLGALISLGTAYVLERRRDASLARREDRAHCVDLAVSLTKLHDAFGLLGAAGPNPVKSQEARTEIGERMHDAQRCALMLRTPTGLFIRDLVMESIAKGPENLRADVIYALIVVTQEVFLDAKKLGAVDRQQAERVLSTHLNRRVRLD